MTCNFGRSDKQKDIENDCDKYFQDITRDLFHYSYFPQSAAKKLNEYPDLGDKLLNNIKNRGGVMKNIKLSGILISYHPKYCNEIYDMLHNENEISELKLSTEPKDTLIDLLYSMSIIYIDQFSNNYLGLTKYSSKREYLDYIYKMVSYFKSIGHDVSDNFRLKKIIAVHNKINSESILVKEQTKSTPIVLPNHKLTANITKYLNHGHKMESIVNKLVTGSCPIPIDTSELKTNDKIGDLDLDEYEIITKNTEDIEKIDLKTI